MGKDYGRAYMARRFTIITLFAAIFAFSFSAVVNRNAGGGAQSHFGANYTCLAKGPHLHGNELNAESPTA
jgi:hypothetical protein